MQSSDQSDSSSEKQIFGIKVFAAVEVTDEDLIKASNILPSECPRRYCWWWRSLSFEWTIRPSEGCTYLESEKRPHWWYTEYPCRRVDPSSIIDHFEPREPHIEWDGVDASRWLARRDANNSELQPPGNV